MDFGVLAACLPMLSCSEPPLVVCVCVSNTRRAFGVTIVVTILLQFGISESANVNSGESLWRSRGWCSWLGEETHTHMQHSAMMEHAFCMKGWDASTGVSDPVSAVWIQGTVWVQQCVDSECSVRGGPQIPAEGGTGVRPMVEGPAGSPTQWNPTCVFEGHQTQRQFETPSSLFWFG